MCHICRHPPLFGPLCRFRLSHQPQHKSVFPLHYRSILPYRWCTNRLILKPCSHLFCRWDHITLIINLPIHIKLIFILWEPFTSTIPCILVALFASWHYPRLHTGNILDDTMPLIFNCLHLWQHQSPSAFRLHSLSTMLNLSFFFISPNIISTGVLKWQTHHNFLFLFFPGRTSCLLLLIWCTFLVSHTWGIIMFHFVQPVCAFDHLP